MPKSAVLSSLALLLLAATGGADARAQVPRGAAALPDEERPRFENLTPREGLSDLFAWPMLQDRQGFIWIGTLEGLNRYDGYSVTTYGPDPRDSTSLRHPRVDALLEDAAGALWVGGLGGLHRMDRSTGRFTYVALDPSLPRDSLRQEAVDELLEARDGTLWVGTHSGLFALRPPDRSPERVYRPVGSDSSGTQRTTALAEEGDGTLWVGTMGAGLHHVDPGTGEARVYRHDPQDPASLASDEIWDLEIDRRGTLWVATRAGLCRFEPARDAFSCYRHDPGDPGSLSDDDVQSIFEDEQGRLWLGTGLGGVSVLDPETDTFTFYRHDPTDPTSLPEDDVHNIIADRFSTFWFAHHARGVSRMTPGRFRFQTQLAVPDAPRNAPVNNVTGILEAEDGGLWIATEYGLVHRDSARGAATQHLPFPDVPYTSQILENPNLLVNLVRDAAGRIWTGNARGDLLLFEPERRAFRRIEAPAAKSWVTPVAIDREGFLWVSTDGAGVWRVDPRTESVVPYLTAADGSGAADGQGTYVMVDRRNTLWVASVAPEGTSATFYQYDRERDAFTSWPVQLPAHLKVGSAYTFEEEPGIFWLGTSAGLMRVDAPEGEMQLYSQSRRHFGRSLNVLQRDEAGRLWFGSWRGSFGVFDPRSHTVTSYFAEDGIQLTRVLLSSRSASGELTFMGFGGYTRFHPDDLFRGGRAPAVHITAVHAVGKELAVGESGSLELPHDQNDLTFEFVGLHFTDPTRNQYRYRLDGFDKEWVDVGTQRMALYPQLPPGRYTFRVRAASSEGIWSAEDAVFSFVVRTPWWRTGWAYLLYGLVLVAGIVAVDRIQRRRLIRRERDRIRESELEQAREIERAYAELKRTQARLVQQEKLASLGSLTAGIAHEIKNPLNFINNFAALSRDLTEELVAELAAGTPREEIEPIVADLQLNVTKIEEHGRRADGIVRSMLEHSRGTRGERTPTDVNALVEEYVSLCYHGMRAQKSDFNVTIERAYDPAAGRVELIPQEIGRVLLNLIGNAFYAVHQQASSNGSAAYAPTVRIATLRQGETVEIRVEDNGPGIPEAVRDRIFEPFFTTKPTGEGTGLGLSLSYEIVTRGHGGALQVESAPGGPTVFSVQLPVTAAREADARPAPHLTNSSYWDESINRR